MSIQVHVSYRDEEMLWYYLQRMMDILDLKDGRVSWHLSLEFEAYLEIISSNVNVQEIPDDDEKKRVVRQAAVRLRKYSRHSLPLFKRALRAEARSRLETAWLFKVLMLLNVSQRSLADFSSFDVLGYQLGIHKWSNLQKLELKPLWQEATLALPEHRSDKWWYTRFTPVLCTVRCADVRGAVRRASQPFGTLASLFNLVEKWGSIEYQFGGRSRPLARVLPSPIFAVFNEDGAYQKPLFFTEERYEYPAHSLKPEQVRLAANLAERLWPLESKQDIKSLLTDIVQEYGQALYTTDWQQGFLMLWQILEAAALQTPEESNMKTVTGRISILLGHDKLLTDHLQCARRTRNELVHRGKFSEQGLNQVNLLKAVVDAAINRLFAKLDDLPEIRSLKAFYQFGSVNDVDLREAKRVIELLLAGG